MPSFPGTVPISCHTPYSRPLDPKCSEPPARQLFSMACLSCCPRALSPSALPQEQGGLMAGFHRVEGGARWEARQRGVELRRHWSLGCSHPHTLYLRERMEAPVVLHGDLQPEGSRWNCSCSRQRGPENATSYIMPDDGTEQSAGRESQLREESSQPLKGNGKSPG